MTDHFKLPASPGFRRLHPDLPVRMYHRHLPHCRQAGATYENLKLWREIWERSHPQPRSEAWLDEGHPREQWVRWIHSEWDEMGWGFKDE
ncbi:MAG: hypothetical protein NXI28_07250 [bacterium]|nr:hypothetical protein [bacterium]